MTRSRIALLTLCAIIGLPLAALTQPAPPRRVTYTVARDTLTVGDSHRDWSVVWQCDWQVNGTPTLAPVDLVNREHTVRCAYHPIGWPPVWWERHFHTAFKVPASCPPGRYQIRCGGVDTGQWVNVAKQAPMPPQTILSPGTGDDSERIEAALAAGDVTLLPGLYRTGREIRIPAGRTITGHGAVWRRIADGRSYRERLFRAVPGVTFDGLTFELVDYLTHGDDPAPDMVFTGCTFRTGQLGHWAGQRGLLVERCRFERAGTGTLAGGVFHANQWVGICHVGHAFCCERSDGLAVLDAAFDGTDRGLVLRSGRGPCDRVLTAGVDLRNLQHVPNGNEIFTTEGSPTSPGVTQSLFLRWRAHNCAGEFSPWNAPFKNNLMWDAKFSGVGITLYGSQGAVQSGNEFRDVELVGGGVYCGQSATGNRFVRVASVRWSPTRANQNDSDPRRYDVRPPFYSLGIDNVCESCTVVGHLGNEIARGMVWR